MTIRTTLEMDKIYTEDDIKNRFYVMKPCSSCAKYSKHDTRVRDEACPYCRGKISPNGRFWYSIRTWTGDRKLTVADKKKLG